MNCEKIQEIILTDYIDEQLTGQAQKLVEEHLLHCATCREFAAHAIKTVAEPLSYAQAQNPSPELWLRIKEEIEAKRIQEHLDPSITWVDALKNMFKMPIPVFALGAVIAVVLMVGVSVHPLVNQAQYATGISTEQTEYLAYLSDSSTSDDKSLGTNIEQYFL